MVKQTKGVMYGIIHHRLKSCINGSESMGRKDLFVIFGRVYHIPKAKRHLVMEELIDLKLIKVVVKDRIKIL